MNAVEMLLVAFDDAFGHRWESLRDALDGVTDEVSRWQPPAYADEPHAEGVGVPGTIAWHVHHLLHCHRHYAEALDQRPARPKTPPPGEMPWPTVKVALQSANAELRKRIAALTPDDLDQPCRNDDRVGSFVAMFTRHVAWHAGQIKLMRRLQAHAAAG